MRRIRLVMLAAVVAVSSVVWSATPAAAAAPAAAPAAATASYYLSLGDSLAQGVQPVPPPDGPSTPTDQGYPDQLYRTLRAANPSLRLVKMGCPGESTSTMVNGGGLCATRYTTGDQLADAVRFLQANRGHVAYVTINIGSNDVLGCVRPTGIDATCTLGEIRMVRTNLDTIVRTLRGSLDRRGVRAAGMTYYDPLLASWPANRSLATQSVIFTDLLNAVEAATYLHHGFRVAPVAFAYRTNNFSIPQGSAVPINVARICRLTWMCTSSPPNIHPKKQGYRLIATTFARTLR